MSGTIGLEVQPGFSTRHGALTITNGTVLFATGLLFGLPNLVLASAFQPLPAAAIVAGTVGSLFLAASAQRRPGSLLARPVNGRALAAYLVVALAILILGGETHVFYANPDWLIRDAVLADIVRNGILSAYDVDGQVFVLRAPLGMYLLPGLIGHGLGLKAAHVALLAQNSLLLGALLYILGQIGRGWRHVAILLLFAGAPIVFRLVVALALGDLSPLLLTERPLDEWHLHFQYSSSFTQFFWVPNHALPAWWLATLALLQAREETDTAILGTSIALSLIWSPLVVIAPAIFILVFTLRAPRRILASRRTYLGALASLGLLPVAAYLTIAGSTIQAGMASEKPDFALWYVVFIAIQLPAAAYLALEWRTLRPELRRLVAASIAILLVLPFFVFGPGNDLVMRGSIPALVILAFAFGDVLVAEQRTGSRGRVVAGLVILALALPSSVVETIRAVTSPAFAVSSCSLMQASRILGDPGAPANYMARADAFPLGLMRAAPSGAAEPTSFRDCWPDLERPDRNMAGAEIRRFLRPTIEP